MVQRTRIGKLDFDDIKASIKTYLSSQSEFTDYNFEGAAITQLINVLAYNAHYDALSANFMMNEVFLDTATKRSSIVSRAKELGYTPRSRRASTTILEITLGNVTNGDTLTSLVIPAGTRFTTSIGNESFLFTTRDGVSLARTFEGGQYIFKGQVKVYEGVLTQFTTTYNSTANIVQIPNTDIDTSTLAVTAITSVTSNGTSQVVATVDFFQPANFLSVDASSRVFLIQEGFNGFEVYFGDGVMGLRPDNGAAIKMSYIVTSGDIANGAVNFRLASAVDEITTNSTILVSSLYQSMGGEMEESLEEIRLNAKGVFATQNRAVVASDYSALAKQNFATIKDVVAWDGSDNIPPKFGKVVLCAIPALGDTLLDTDKKSIATFLQNKAVANTKIDFVDPEYVNIKIDGIVKYDTSQLNLSTYALMMKVVNAISAYSKTSIQKFSGIFRYSSLVSLIDSSDYAILGNETKVSLFKRLSVTIFSSNNFKFAFENNIVPGSITSSNFYDGVNSLALQLKDDGNGILSTYYSKDGAELVQTLGVGTVKYATGEVVLNNLIVSNVMGTDLLVYAVPAGLDILSSKNVILNLAMSDITISVIKG